MPGLIGLTTTAWWLKTCWNCQRQHQAYDSKFERRQHQSSFLEPWPLMINDHKAVDNSDDVDDGDDEDDEKECDNEDGDDGPSNNFSN